jgi:hypothetical protein
MTFRSGWGGRIDFDSTAPITEPPLDRCPTALPLEPFELPQPRLSIWMNKLLKFENENENEQLSKESSGI